MKSEELLQEQIETRLNKLLLRTKLRAPVIQQRLSSRVRIDGELNKGLKGRLTLVTAPAGFGKTTAVADWLSRVNIQAAWFSVDIGDNSMKRFWCYLVAALDERLPGLESRLSQYLYEAGSITAEGIATVVVDELYASKKEILLVIDDYHLISEESIHKSLELLIRYMPQSVHAILISRTRPPFASARLKAEGQLKEIRLGDLQFTGIEIEQYCRQKGIKVSKNDVSLLEARTEGWAAGLYLTLETAESEYSLTGLQSGAGWNSRRIASYLTEEVLDRRSAEETAFMLKTSVLTTMCGSLCDALTGWTNGREMLERLSSNNAFILAMDNEGNWYRYHHLYAEFLREKLDREGTVEQSSLHERAGEWYERNDYPSEAVDHYMKSGKYELAVRVIEGRGAEMVRMGCFSTLTEWLGRLPDDLTGRSDMLCLTYTWLLALSGRIGEAEKWIGLMEARYIHQPADNMPEQWKRQMQTEILAYRGVIGLNHEKPEKILQIIMKLQEVMADTSIFCSAGINLNQGDASLMPGLVGIKGQLCKIDSVFAGVYEKARQNAIKKYFGYIPALMGEMAFERNETEKAVPLLMKGIEEAEGGNSAGSYVPAVITLARLMKSRGDFAGASALLTEGERKLKDMGAGHMVPVFSAFRARLAMETEDDKAIVEWLERSCLDIYDKPSRLRVYEYITLLRTLIYRRAYEGCLLLLPRLLLLAETERN
ncbi:MAG: hypothetical protein HGA22_07120, partial [Clostridiales bacterium]|nr:hypothetical protein [Clostridiales bacterium]